MESPTCDAGLEEAVKSIIYAAPRTEIKELQAARQLLVEKYGKDFALEAMENKDGAQVAERVGRRLRVEPPSEELVVGYLREIARTYGVEWPPGEYAEKGGGGAGEEGDDDDDEPSTGEKERVAEAPLPAEEELSKATPPRDLGPKSPVQIAPPSPSTENVSPRVKLPGPPELKPGSRMADRAGKAGTAGGKAGGKGGGGGLGDSKDVGGTKKGVVPGKVPDVDELAKRFAALKK